MSDPMDFTVLELDDMSRERLVASILAAAAPALARRGEADVSPLVILSGWLRPALAAAAVLALLCVSVLVVEVTTEQAGPLSGLADALAVPQPADAWLVGERAPTVADLLVAMEREAR
jgi:hypothetical protein